jgi:hypothetical protein
MKKKRIFAQKLPLSANKCKNETTTHSTKNGHNYMESK